MRRLALYSATVCALSAAAATVSYLHGRGVVGTVWVLLAGVSSNMAWYYFRRARPRPATVPPCGSAGEACGTCVRSCA
ncbi:hypothetical protein I3F58_21925 [Streptomyces sp. MUM 203J]|uniref:hypothetical protein n=1 Tax=Streptomyces sp. MUM 203J TaxID=2791990 RepID=UPI001F0452E1|nr:hypothetical protein [Streptomyces sp. MUM 203J]MCH0542162.1 hypothetical protein [Streptomyces sp. MUM 203J]